MENRLAPAGHPIHTLMEEHRILLEYAARLVNLAQKVKPLGSLQAAASQLQELTDVSDAFKASASHYLREENVIFPLLDKHGFSGPPQVMWAEHDQIRAIEKNFFQLMDHARGMAFDEFAASLKQIALQQSQMLQNHYFKENNILFPHALEILTDEEWQQAIREFGRIGYCPFTPKEDRIGGSEEPAAAAAQAEVIQFSTGTLTKEVLEAIFSTLPVELTFVDADDTFRFFSHLRGAIFTRSTATLGTRVQNCHPQKSLHLVNKILSEFKDGSRDVAEFWINLQGKLMHIRYFAVRDKSGKYLGSLEVTQDITEIKKIEGEKRLL